MRNRSHHDVVNEIKGCLEGIVSADELKMIMRAGDYTNHELSIIRCINSLKRALVLKNDDSGFEKTVTNGEVLLPKGFFEFSSDDQSARYDPNAIAVLSIRQTSWDRQTNKKMASRSKLVIFIPPVL